MSRKQVKFYGKQDSPFYKLKTKKKLAKLLRISVEKLKFLAASEKLYFEFPKKKSDGGSRLISAPRDDLKKVQKRIADLLQRIAPPDYLFAPVSGRSYVDNAAHHLGADSVVVLDIEDFFSNCTANKVIWFFLKQMECSPDVAAILRGIVTRRDSLPQGSPCSPILAYLCYLEMWEEIKHLVNALETVAKESTKGALSIADLDNLTVSGIDVAILRKPEKLIFWRNQLARYGESGTPRSDCRRVQAIGSFPLCW